MIKLLVWALVGVWVYPAVMKWIAFGPLARERER